MGLALKASIDSINDFQNPIVSLALYQPEALSIKGIRKVSERVAEVCFEFKNLSQVKSHQPVITSGQIHNALCEGFYETMGLFSTDTTLPFGIDESYVLSSASAWMMLKLDILFRRQILPNTKTIIQFEIADISAQRFRKTQCSVTMNFSGYVSGQMTYLLPNTCIE